MAGLAPGGPEQLVDERLELLLLGAVYFGRFQFPKLLAVVLQQVTELSIAVDNHIFDRVHQHRWVVRRHPTRFERRFIPGTSSWLLEPENGSLRSLVGDFGDRETEPSIGVDGYRIRHVVDAISLCRSVAIVRWELDTRIREDSFG